MLGLFTSSLFSVMAQTKSAHEADGLRWINEHASEFKLNPQHTFSLRAARKTEWGETLRFQQMQNNVPVFGTEILIHFDAEGLV